MSNLSTGTLRAYEVLKGFTDGSGSKVEALIQFIRPTLSQFHNTQLDVAKFADRVNSELHLAVTSDTILGLAPELVKKGWLKEIKKLAAEQTYIVDCSDNAVSENKYTTIVGKIIPKFREFIEEFGFDQIGGLSDEGLFEMLMECILSLENLDDISTLQLDGRKEIKEDQQSYVCARFISELSETDAEFTDDIVELSKLGLIGDLVREFQKPQSSVKRTNVQIYIDSPLLMELIGLSGPKAQKSIAFLIKVAKSKGAGINVFAKSIKEMRQNLKTTFGPGNPSYQRYGATHEAVQRGDTSLAFVQSVIQNAENIIKSEYGINIFNKIPNSNYFGNQDLDKLRNDLSHAYSGQHQSGFRADHDATAVASIMRLRSEGSETNDLWSAGHIFLTRNRKFKETARTYCMSVRSYGGSGDYFYDDDDVGPVVDIRELASSIWLRFGDGSNDEIPRLHLLAGCERILRFNKKSMQKIQSAVLKLGLDPEKNSEKIDQIRITLMNPIGAMRTQDMLRGSNREATYQVVLAAQKAAEDERIAKGIMKSSEDIQREYQATKKLYEKEKEILSQEIIDRDRIIESKKANEEELLETKSAIENQAIVTKKENIQLKIGKINFSIAEYNRKSRFRIWVYRATAAIIMLSIIFIEKLTSLYDASDVLISIKIPFTSLNFELTVFILSIIISLFILYPANAYVGIWKPKVKHLRELVFSPNSIAEIRLSVKHIEDGSDLNLEFHAIEDGFLEPLKLG